MRRISRAFETDEEEQPVKETEQAEYVFDGFEVEFSDKIALTPPGPKD